MTNLLDIPRASRERRELSAAFFAGGAARALGVLERRSVEAVLRESYDAAPRTLQLAMRAAQAPASTSDPNWASALTREQVANAIDIVAPDSVLAALPLVRLGFDGAAKLRVPARGPAESSLAADWRAEGDAIHVGGLHLDGVQLTPKSLGTIGTFSAELVARAVGDVALMVQQAMQRDSAIALDRAFLDSDPGSTLRPAGMQALAVSRPSSGSDVDSITSDLLDCAAAMIDSGCGLRPMWVGNTLDFQRLATLRTASGALGFPSLSNAPPTLLDYGVVASPNAPTGLLFLIDCAEVVLASQEPKFDQSAEATLHEESVDPLPLADGAGVVASPSRAMFQTNCIALRAVWETDWNLLAAGAVQCLSGLALRVQRKVPAPKPAARFRPRETVVKESA
jgi:HK97 family phage major capsid protein